MTKSNRLIFFGNERLATGVTTDLPILHGLIKAGYEVAAIVTSYKLGRSRRARKLEVARFASSHDIPLISPDKLSSQAEELAELGAEVGILAAYGRLAPQELISLFPKGIVNIHPSLLPLYRGSSPIEQAILDNANQTGVSLMQLTDKMDAGPVYARQVLKLKGNEAKQELTDNLDRLGADMLLEYLPLILNGQLKAEPQDESQATYTKRLTPADSLVDLTKPAEVIAHEVRAYQEFPRSKIKIHGNDVILTKVRVAKDKADGDLMLKTDDGWLAIEELMAPSGRTMSGADFLRGYSKTKEQ